MVSRTLSCQGEPGLRGSSGPLERPPLVQAWHDDRHYLQKEGGLDRCFQHRSGALCEGKPAFGSWSDTEGQLHINCLEMMAVCSSPSEFLTGPEGTLRASPLRQHDSGILYKSARRAHLKMPFRDGKTPLGVGASRPAVIEGSTCAWRIEPRSRHASPQRSVCSTH